MPRFCVNQIAQPNGDHEVHDLSASCPKLPAPHNRHDLGNHTSCVGAVAEAKRIYPRSNGCYWCAEPCHTS